MIEITRISTSTSTIINVMIAFQSQSYFVLLSSLTHIVRSFNVSSSIK